MKVLLTGAFGNVGQSALIELLDRGHQVRSFEVMTRANKKMAKRFTDKCEVVWGDLRDVRQVATAVVGQDAVIHLAFVIPTLSATGVGSEEDPELAYAINVTGTRNLIEAVKLQDNPPKFIFTSSLHIYGRTHDQPPPRTINDPPKPIEHYAHHKVICEKMLVESGLEWAVYRLGAVLPLRLILDMGMFGVPLDNRIEFVHARDVAVALTNGLENNEIWGGVWHIGGGPRCQLYQHEIMEQVLNAVGIGSFPEQAFTKVPFPTDWLETGRSEEILQFQQRTLDDYVSDLKDLLGFRRHIVRLFRPIIRRWLLSQSPAWQVYKAKEDNKEKVALITGASSGIGKATARKLALSGYQIILVARSRDRLERIVDQIQVDGGRAQLITVDLEEELESYRLYEEIRSKVGPIDVLVNSAGSGWYGFSDEMPWPQASKMIDLNIRALTNLTLLFLADMKQRGQGQIINVSSVAGGLPSQGVALYGATKSYVDAFTTSLHRELRGSGVHVCSIRPGAVRTPFLGPIASELRGFGFPVRFLAIKPERVAAEIIKLIQRPRRVVYVPRVLRLVPWFELSFGWLIDLLGPLVLGKQKDDTLQA